MKIVILTVTIVVVLLVLVRLSKRKFVAAEVNVKASDIDAIFAKLDAVQKDGSFAVFVFTASGGTPTNDAVNIQFSIEGGRSGFDWVLLAPGNLRDESRFRQFAHARGYSVIDREMNNVKYLRVEGPKSLPHLCRAVICEMYQIAPDADIDLIPEGFTWP